MLYTHRLKYKLKNLKRTITKATYLTTSLSYPFHPFSPSLHTLPLCPSVWYCETSFSGFFPILITVYFALYPIPHYSKLYSLSLSLHLLSTSHTRSHSSLFKSLANPRSSHTHNKVKPIFKPFFDTLCLSLHLLLSFNGSECFCLYISCLFNFSSSCYMLGCVKYYHSIVSYFHFIFCLVYQLFMLEVSHRLH